MSYAEDSLLVPSISGAADATGQAAHGPAPPVADDPRADVHVTPQHQQPVAGAPGDIVSEEKIEYRDEEGNLLDEDQVASLSGKVSFQTRYETRTRLVDEHGNEVWDRAEGEAEPVAGTNIDGAEPGTENAAGEGDASTKPPRAEAGKGDVEEIYTAEPEEDVGKETGKDEL